jgi:hypothetical protein
MEWSLKYSSWRISWGGGGHQAWALFSLFTTTKWGGGKEESDLDWYGKNHAWRIQNFRSVLGRSDQHVLPCHQPIIYSPTPQKTSYELLTVDKPNVSYFIVFGSKCYILVKRGRNSKYTSKVVERFLLGYDSNTRAYRFFNKSIGYVEVSCDVVFDSPFLEGSLGS